MELSSAIFAAFPVLGGYGFARLWTVSAVDVTREDGHKLYFRATYYGLFIFGFLHFLYILPGQAHLILSFYVSRKQNESLIWDLKAVWPHTLEFQTVCLLAAIVGPVAASIANSLGARLKWYDKWASGKFHQTLEGKPLEELLYASTRGTKMPIAFSMDDNLVFIGYWVSSSAPTEERKWIKILPFASGHRESDGRMQLRTDYKKMFDAIANHDTSVKHLKTEDFLKVIDAERIVAANFFDIRAFAKFGTIYSAAPPANQGKNS